MVKPSLQIPSIAVVMLITTGCWLSTEEVSEKLPLPDEPVDTDTSTPPLDPLEVSDIDPEWGSTLGGSEVIITAGPLAGSAPDVDVRFGGVAATVTSVVGDEITVITPAGNEGWTDLRVENAGRIETTSSAFRYYADATGKAGAIGSYSWTEYPGFDLNFSPIDDRGSVWVMPIVPLDTTYAVQVFHTGTMDTCKSNESGSTVTPLNLQLSSVDLLRSGSDDSLSLLYRPDDERFQASLSSGDFIDGASYDLGPLSGDGWPADLTIENIVELPSAFTVSTPNLGWSSVGDIPVMSQNIQFQWSTSESTKGDWIGLWIERYDDPFFGTPEVQDIVTCVVEDDGSFQLSSAVWSGWNGGGQIWMHVVRVREPVGTLPHNNALSQVVGAYWIGGVGIQTF